MGGGGIFEKSRLTLLAVVILQNQEWLCNSSWLQKKLDIQGVLTNS